MKKLSILAVSVVFLTGCFRAHVATGAPRGGHTESRTGVSLLWGLTGTDAAAVECPHGVASASTFWPWYAVPVAVVTAGIVTPIQMDYVCASME